MEKLAYLASLSVLATGIVFAQNAGTPNPSDSNSSGNSSAETSRSHNRKAQPKSGGQSSDLTGAEASTPATSPSTDAPVPTVIIHDRAAPAASPNAPKDQAGQQRIGSMGTTGNTPETSAPQSTSPDQQPNSSAPDSPPPHTSLVGSPKLNGSSVEILAAVPRRPPHAPDAGTQPNPLGTEVSETSFGESTAAPVPR